MALIYLLAMRVNTEFNVWPKMIPVMTESRRYKFIKKGGDLNTELVRLFDFMAKDKKDDILKGWCEKIVEQMGGVTSEEERSNILGPFLKAELDEVLMKEYVLRVKKGQ